MGARGGKQRAPSRLGHLLGRRPPPRGSAATATVLAALSPRSWFTPHRRLLSPCYSRGGRGSEGPGRPGPERGAATARAEERAPRATVAEGLFRALVVLPAPAARIFSFRNPICTERSPLSRSSPSFDREDAQLSLCLRRRSPGRRSHGGAVVPGLRNSHVIRGFPCLLCVLDFFIHTLFSYQKDFMHFCILTTLLGPQTVDFHLLTGDYGKGCAILFCGFNGALPWMSTRVVVSFRHD